MEWFLLIAVLIAAIIIVKINQNKCKKEIEKSQDIIRHLEAQNCQLQSTTAELQRLNESLSRRLSDFDDSKLADLKMSMSLMERRIVEREQELLNLQERYGELFDEFSELVRSNQHLQITYDQGVAAVQELEGAQSNLMRKVSATKDELSFWAQQALEARNRVDMDDDQGLGNIGALDKRELRLRALIGELKVLYPELRLDLGTIEWKKLWLNRMQKLVGEMNVDGVCGIYRLVRLEDGACYIGQATNIKERWYTHAKKMVGAMGCGNEKLYSGGDLYCPADFTWEVVCEVEDRSKLNEVEQYWISYYKASLNW